MVQNVLVYEIQPKDSLDSIAQKIGMSTNELLDFHNAHCGEFGLLWITGLAGIKKIVVPKNYKSVAQIRKAITDVLPPQNLSPEFYAAKYKVTESFVDSYGKKVEINYDTEINSPQNQTSSSAFFAVEVHPKNFEKNGSKPDDKISELAMACMKTISPFAFNVSPQGKILGIADFKNVQETFATKKEDLQDFFIGDVSAKYIEQFEIHLKNEAYFLQQYSSNLLHQSLFPNPEWFYHQGIWEEKFHIVKNSFLVSMVFTTTHEHLDAERIQTKMKGKANEDVSLQDLLSGRKFGDDSAEPLDATLEMIYITDKLTKKLLDLKGSVILSFEDEIFKKHQLKITKS